MVQVFRIAIAMLLLCGTTAMADPLRIATYNAGLSRKGPGLVLRDLMAGEAQAAAAVAVIAHAAPDVLLVTGLDYDYGQAALTALTQALAAEGMDYAHRFTARPNSGMMTALDLDGDGRRGTADDAQGYGRFAGAGGMAVLSRFPLGAVRDHSDFLWRDLPGALLPQVDGKVYPSDAVFDVQRLASVGIWQVPVLAPGGEVTLLAFHAGPPVFGGPHDRNLRRNHDETAFWSAFLDGALPVEAPAGAFILLGDANLDPERGDGMGGAMRALLDHPRLQDPLPGLPTVAWERVGEMRVDYALPSRDLQVVGAGVLAPPEGDPLHEAVEAASRHRLVWVDVVPDP